MGFTHEGVVYNCIPEVIKQKYRTFNPVLKSSTEKFLLYIANNYAYSGQCVENFNLYWGREATNEDRLRIFYCTFGKKIGSSTMNGIFLRDKDSTGNKCMLFAEFEKTMPYPAEKKEGYRCYEASNVNKIKDVLNALEKLETQLDKNFKPYFNSALVRDLLENSKEGNYQ